MNEQNLTPFNRMDPDLHKKISREGGIRSGESRQKRKLLREELQTLLSSGDVQERICLGLIRKCEAGDPRAFGILRDTLGERLPDGLDLNVTGSSQDLQEWKQKHLRELQELFLEDMTREDGLQRYEGITSILSFEERKHVLVHG